MTFTLEVTDPKRLKLMQAYADEMDKRVKEANPDCPQESLWTLGDVAYSLFCDGIRYCQSSEGVLKDWKNKGA